MRYTVAEIASALEAEAVGDTSAIVTGLAEPAQAGADDLALASNPKYAGTLSQGAAQAALLWEDADWQAFGLRAAILPKRPRFAMSRLTTMADPGHAFGSGVHPGAIVDPTATLGADVTIGAGAVIGPEAQIGDGSVIGPMSFVGWRAMLGPNAFLREQVSIGARVQIGANFIANPGVRIGGDGFSFVTPEKSGVENVRETLGEQGDAGGQPWARIASLGAVVIGDDVEVGTNTAIDSGTIRPTQIGNRTKIDNLVHIGHNCVIGEDNLICGQVGLAGSVTVGNFVVMAGQVGVSDNLTIGNNVVLAAACKVMSSVKDGKVMLGYPANEMKTNLDMYKNTKRLPRILRDVAELKKAVFKSDGSD
ncbi:UDP-3-O-(3-hydroxymyristoyl)glucosamine N-acyltransferase [Tateyamaria omphalii]|uniref:UDP-3-O-(3-hydroxymyristoyl)glucosamine N-acyltransferase n=1 Tax=Tateyamaria omphalii TaxID=299262 RepID=UPI001C99A2BD|nr:UDP-3-O-(3-hydroxymyristoyl)glucosamine N-acyltransferase [Tateyamaria omphalii]MBY5932511.1 UDP-3-O-(3-hydroxymyristoyl)glucosamine N-acyltransferase [Tateyamaria omphalii]